MTKNLFYALLCLNVVLVAFGAYPAAVAQETADRVDAANDISGTYSFLKEGEYLQITVEDGKLSGYISRYGDSDSDKGQFINQFFDKTTLDDKRLSFNTKTVHGVSYDFIGVISTTPGKSPAEEGYRVIRGKLIENTTDEKDKKKTMQRQVEFKSFPADVNR
ncbi:MAG TPA: hypothetical protein VFB04_03545 [Terriglobales bacterium]|nr:hypothetical protein [Terriglobales bacterium]